MEMSGELTALRAEGLSIVGRTTQYTGEEWWQDRKRRESPKYSKWGKKCEKLGAQFGLAPWTVQMACLIKGYSPEKENFIMETNWPKIRVVTDNADPLFLRWLCYEAQKLGLKVILKTAPLETSMITMDPAPPTEPLTDFSRPPGDNAFNMRVETPPDYPPEAAKNLHQMASNLGRELLRCLGYHSPKRLRSSPLMTVAKQLKADKSKLTEAESLQIVDDLYPEHDMSQDSKLLKRCKSQKNQVRQRITRTLKRNH